MITTHFFVHRVINHNSYGRSGRIVAAFFDHYRRLSAGPPKKKSTYQQAQPSMRLPRLIPLSIPPPPRAIHAFLPPPPLLLVLLCLTSAESRPVSASHNAAACSASIISPNRRSWLMGGVTPHLQAGAGEARAGTRHQMAAHNGRPCVARTDAKQGWQDPWAHGSKESAANKTKSKTWKSR